MGGRSAARPAAALAMAFLSLILVSLFWGGHAVVGKAVEQQFAPLPLTVWRFTLTAVCYLPFFGRFRHLFRLPVRVKLQLVLASLCWAVLYPLFYYQALRTLSPLETLLLVNTAPLVAVLFSFVFLRERLRGLEIAGIVVSFLGVAALVVLEGVGSVAAGTGITMAIMSALAFAGYTVSSRSLFQNLPLFDVLLGTSVIGAVMLWMWTLLSGQVGYVSTALRALHPSGWWQFLYIVLIVSTAAYALYGYGLRRLPAGIASALTFYPQVLFAAVIEWVWLGIVPQVATLIGAALILGGTVLMRIRPKRGSPSVPDMGTDDAV
ncbi:DMT family transporter [Alicyclobacillus sp. ALC3]|uniref:DMT family transporter n=1 Tax=Alicyclobacillus sp. ALC3 TaxID=2796143 RepID=UPI002379312C|nr:DMT family transporter [Alicyclobacillus sp. ALC3]WDL98528.1 DMT family transporter [Alicyclobacillus sp. ALC3]